MSKLPTATAEEVKLSGKLFLDPPPLETEVEDFLSEDFSCGSGAENPQLFTVVDRGEKFEGDLHNAKDPNLKVESESIRHRTVMYLRAQGLTYQKISEKTGYTIPWISQICRQPWFRKQLTQFLDETGRSAIETILQNEAINSVFTLIEVRDSAAAKPSERTSAANALLDRHLGKPKQTVDQNHKVMPTDEKELDAKIAAIENELGVKEAQVKTIESANNGAAPTDPHG